MHHRSHRTSAWLLRPVSLPLARRLVPKTVNPARAKASALARPMPEEAPVTIAVFPEFELDEMLQSMRC